MKHACLILAHAHEVQLARLVDRLREGDATVFIHVDGKNDPLFARMSERYARSSDVRLVHERVRVNRGGFSQVAATLRLMEAVEASGRDFDHVSLLSAQDYPIKSPAQISAFLERHRGRQFIEANDIGPNFWRLKCFNFFGEHPKNRTLPIRILDNLLRRPQMLLLRRRNFRGLKLYKGSTWFTLTGECLRYVLGYVRSHPEYVADFRYSYCPDESFFHTLVLNSPFSESVINDDLTWIDWEHAVLGSPRELTTEDLPTLLASGDLFARKFDLTIDSGVLDALDRACRESRAREAT